MLEASTDTQSDLPVIRTVDLTKTFRSFRKPNITAVHNVNLMVAPRQVYGFLGPNGAGKSTTIRMLLNLVKPTTGEVYIFGKNPQEYPAVLRNVGALVEGATFYPYLNAWENLTVVGRTLGQFDEQRARELLDFVGLTSRATVSVGKYSTGMKQRLGIAAALLHNPQLVILDEPTNGMDPMGIQAMRTFIRRLADEFGKTVFLTSHILDEVQQTCDQVAIIHEGEIRASGTIKELLLQEKWLQLEVSDTAASLAVLDDWQSVAVDSSNIRVQVSHEESPAVIRTLVQSGLDVYKAVPYQRSLEDYFFEVVEAEISLSGDQFR